MIHYLYLNQFYAANVFKFSLNDTLILYRVYTVFDRSCICCEKELLRELFSSEMILLGLRVTSSEISTMSQCKPLR